MSEVISRAANQFDRQQYNEAKAGFYPTPTDACEELSSLFLFSGKQRVLEPSCGEGDAVLALCDAKQHPENEELKIFGVELNSVRANNAKAKGRFEHVLCADFLSDLTATNASFSFCFANPPYGSESGLESGIKFRERLEKKFMDGICKYLCKDAVIVWVIPHRVMMDDSFVASWMRQFETIHVFKFPERSGPVYAHFQNVVAVVARKRGNGKAVLTEEREAFQKQYALENLSWITGAEEKILVAPAPEVKSLTFRRQTFDSASAIQYEYANTEEDRDLKKEVLKVVKDHQGVFRGNETYYPPKAVSKQNLALLTACGVGSGYAGTKENRDLHLQRGSVERQTQYSVSRDTRTGKETMIEKTFTTTQIVLVESDGTVTDLVKTVSDGMECEDD